MGIALFFENAFFVFFRKFCRKSIKISLLDAVYVVFLPIIYKALHITRYFRTFVL